MLRTYFLIVSILLTIYIFTFNILFYGRKFRWCKYKKLRIKLIYYTIWNWICASYIYIVFHTPSLNPEYLFEYLVLGALFHLVAVFYGYKTTFS